MGLKRQSYMKEAMHATDNVSDPEYIDESDIYYNHISVQKWMVDWIKKPNPRVAQFFINYRILQDNYDCDLRTLDCKAKNVRCN